MALAALLAAGAARFRSSAPMLWVLMLAFPFPYIANTAGWMTAELGRQPWLVYGLMRTVERREPDGAIGHGAVHADRFLPGSIFVLGVLFLFLIGREIAHGPQRLNGRRRSGRTASSRGRTLVEFWFGMRRDARGVRRPRRLRPRRGRAASLRRAHRCRAPAGAWRRSVRSGTATRCGCSRPAARCSSRFRTCSPQGCRASISRFSWCSGR